MNFMKYRVLTAVLLFTVGIMSFAQNNLKSYSISISKADSLLNEGKYEDAALAYSNAIKANGGKAYLFDRYNAASAFSMANNTDSAFRYLDIIATKGAFSYYGLIVPDENFAPLHSDKRWKPLLEVIEQNRMKVIEKSASACGESRIKSIDKNIIPTIKNYTLDVDINVNQKSVSVKGYIDIDFKEQDSIDLVLYGKTKIDAIRYSKKNLKYTFDTGGKSPVMYMPEGKRLTIFKTAGSPQEQKMFFDYSCNMEDLSGWGCSFTEDWIGFGYYAAWYPLHAENKDALSELNITIDDSYLVSGSGKITKNGKKWKMIQDWPIYENAIMASKKLKSKTIEIDSIPMEVVYTVSSDQDADLILATFRDIVEFYKESFGSPNCPFMRLVLSPITDATGGGYARRNFIVLRENKFNKKLIKSLAHEGAHL